MRIEAPLGVIETLRGWALVREPGTDKPSWGDYGERLVVQPGLGGLETVELDGVPMLRKALEDAIRTWWREAKRPDDSLFVRSNGRYRDMPKGQVGGLIEQALQHVLPEERFNLAGTTIEATLTPPELAWVVWTERTGGIGSRRLTFVVGKAIAVEEDLGAGILNPLPPRPEVVERIWQRQCGDPIRIELARSSSSTTPGWKKLILVPLPAVVSETPGVDEG